MSVFTTKDTEIQCGGETFQVKVSSYPARLGIKIQFKLGKLILPLIGDLKSGDEVDTSTPSFSKISSALVNVSVDEQQIETLILQILSSTRVNDKDVSDGNIFDMVFTAKYDLLMDVIKFVLEVNFKSFLGRMGITTGEAA